MAVIPVLATGQSNAIGRQGGGAPFSLTSPRVTVWNNTNPADINAVGFAGDAFVLPVESAPPFDPDGGNNPALWFCQKLAEKHLGDDVRHVNVSRGASAIGEWVTSDDGLAPIADRLVRAWGASGLGPARAVLFIQGESDAGLDPETYKVRVREFLARLVAEGITDAASVVVLTALAKPSAAAIDLALFELSQETPQWRYAPVHGLATVSDGIHYTGDALVRLGYERQWLAYSQQD